MDVGANTWSAVAPMKQRRKGFGAVVLADGQVMVMGGAGVGSRLTSVEFYSPVDDEWSAGPPMQLPREDFGCCRLDDGSVLACGGQSKPCSVSAEMFEPTSSSWRALEDLPLPGRIG